MTRIRVPHDFPDYIKLHIEDEERTATPAPQPSFAAKDRLLQAFEESTGWTLTERPAAKSDQPTCGFGGPSFCGELLIEDMSSHLPAGKSAAARTACDALALSISDILQELNRTRAALWQREAELATAIPVLPHREEESHLATRLEGVLRGAAQAVSCHAAALYLLDDSTSQLKLRSSWGLPAERYLEPSRPLRGSIADLEALVGHAVVLEDTRILPHWNAPEDYPAAVCIPVSSATTPLGTLWVFCERNRDFSTHETELLEIVAGRIVAELEREVLLTQAVPATDQSRQLSLASHWQQERLPSVEPMIDDLRISGWTRQAELIGGDFHDWHVLADSQLAIAVGDAQGSPMEASMTAAVVQATVRAHSNYRQQPDMLLDAVSESMWSSGMGDQFASLFYGVLNPESWDLQFSLCGSMRAYLLRPQQAKQFGDDIPMLGVEPDLMSKRHKIFLNPGDALVVLSEGMRHVLLNSGIKGDESGLASFLQRHLAAGCTSLVSLVKEIGERTPPEGLAFDRSILALQRCGSQTGG